MASILSPPCNFDWRFVPQDFVRQHFAHAPCDMSRYKMSKHEISITCVNPRPLFREILYLPLSTLLPLTSRRLMADILLSCVTSGILDNTLQGKWQYWSQMLCWAAVLTIATHCSGVYPNSVLKDIKVSGTVWLGLLQTVIRSVGPVSRYREHFSDYPDDILQPPLHL